jgi:hypothetical protein
MGIPINRVAQRGHRRDAVFFEDRDQEIYRDRELGTSSFTPLCFASLNAAIIPGVSCARP